MQKRRVAGSPPSQPRRTVPPEGLIIEAEDMFLPGLSPSTLHDRLAEFRQMHAVGGDGGAHQPSLLTTPTALSPQPPTTEQCYYPYPGMPQQRLSLVSPASTPPPEGIMRADMPKLMDGTRHASTARSTVRMARTPSNLPPTHHRPQFVEGPPQPAPGGLDEGGGFGLARIGSSLAPSSDANLGRRRSHFGVFERPFNTSDPQTVGGDDVGARPPSPLEGRRKSSFRADDGAPPNFSRIRRSSTFTHGSGPNGGNPQSGGSGLGALEHQLFKSAPSAVLAKLSSFVNNRNGDGGSWQRLSELMDMHRRGAQMSTELGPTVQRLKNAGDEYPHRIMRRAGQRAEGAGADDDSDDDGPAQGRHPRLGQREMLSEWQDGIATAASLLNNLLGLVSNAVPVLTGTCDAVRRVLLASVYHNGRNLASVLPLPPSLEAAAAETDYSTLRKKMELFSVDPYAVISVETDLKKLGAGGKGPESLMQAVKTVRQLRRRYNTIMSFVTYNMSCWRQLAMGCILRSWRASRSRRLLEESQAVEINNLRAELEFLKSSKKTQQAELLKAATDRSAVVESAEVEKATLQETYQRNAAALSTQVSNLKNLVQSMKKNTEVPLLKEEMAKLQDTNNQLEGQIVKLVDHISNKESQVVALQQKQASLVATIAALSRQVSAVSGHLSIEVQRNKTSLAKVAGLGTGAASIPPLAQWVTDLAQNVMGEDAVYKALVAAMAGSSSNTTRDRSSITMSATDLGNVSIRQGLVRVRDFSEGAAVLDAYACVFYALDSGVVSATDVADVMLEADMLCKGQLVLELANTLFLHGARTRAVGAFVRNPASFLVSADLAFSSSVRPHILMVTSLLAVWMSSMCSISLIAPSEDEAAFLSKPLLLESYVDSTTDPMSVCSARWEQVKDCFVTWRTAVFALHSLLVDYTTEVAARGLTVAVPLSSVHLKGRNSAGGGGGAASTPPSSVPSPSLPYLAQRRQSTLVRPNAKSLEERLLMGQPQSRQWVVEGLKYAVQVLLAKQASQAGTGSAKRAGSLPPAADPHAVAAADPLGATVNNGGGASSEDERLQLTATAIAHRIESEAQRLVGIFQYYAVPTSESAAHNPVLVFGANEAVRLCSDIGMLLTVPPAALTATAEGAAAATVSLQQPFGSCPPSVQCISADECRELVLAIARKRSTVVSASSPLKASMTSPPVASKRHEDALRSAIQLEEFGGLLVRLAARWCAAANNNNTAVPGQALLLPHASCNGTHSYTTQGSSASVVTASGGAATPPGSVGSPTTAAAAAAPVTFGSVDASGTPSSQGVDPLNTPTPAYSKGTMTSMMEDAFACFVASVLLPRAFRVDAGMERSIRTEPSIAYALEEFRPMVALLFGYCCGLPETVAGASTTKRSTAGHHTKTGGAAAASRAAASQGQFKVWCWEVLLQPVGASAAGSTTTAASADAPQPATLPQGNSQPSLPACDAVFAHVQQLDVGKPLLMSLSDFLSALVSLALLLHPSSLLHHQSKIVTFFEDVLEPFAARKFPQQQLRNTIVWGNGDAQQPTHRSVGDETAAHSTAEWPQRTMQESSWDTSMSTDGGALLLGSGGVSQPTAAGSTSRPGSPKSASPSKVVIG